MLTLQIPAFFFTYTVGCALTTDSPSPSRAHIQTPHTHTPQIHRGHERPAVGSADGRESPAHEREHIETLGDWEVPRDPQDELRRQGEQRRLLLASIIGLARVMADAGCLLYIATPIVLMALIQRFRSSACGDCVLGRHD